jgi:hypothetical protein
MRMLYLWTKENLDPHYQIENYFRPPIYQWRCLEHRYLYRQVPPRELHREGKEEDSQTDKERKEHPGDQRIREGPSRR